ncbi:MAG: hypothetical protein ABF718_04205 [Leuconostoc pseudomesenteroides]|uniref:hypothetical protein n=1 Tax=Leuconostoc pseudomesenteroides TaxID=33968 RepID=UPI0039E979B9
MKSFSPKLQKYIDDNTTETQNIGTLVAFIALFVTCFLVINTAVHSLFGIEDLTNLLVYLVELALFTLLIVARVSYVNKFQKDINTSMNDGTFDYGKITNWNRFSSTTNMSRLIVKFKLLELFTNDINSTTFTKTGVTVGITPVKMITSDQIQESVLNAFSVNAENIQFSEDGSSYRFEMSLAGLKLLEPQDIVEYN